MVAVKQNGSTLEYVKEQTPEICAEAVKLNQDAYKYVGLLRDEKARNKFIRELALLLN